MILCTYCNTYRLANEAPCTNCGAPSPLVGGEASSNAAWNSLDAPTGLSWNTELNNLPPQQGFPTNGQQPFSGLPPQQGFPTNGQQGFPGMLPQQGFAQDQQGSMLPVPYNPQAVMLFPQDQFGNTGALIPATTHVPGPLVPGVHTEEEAIYIPPMFTKPRPIIPRYRAISGMASVLIVVLLLCGGTTYFARATGKLDFLNPLFQKPPNITQANGVNLPDPQPRQDGPASTIITSAATAPQLVSGAALQQSQVFQVNQQVFLTYSVHPKKPGVVTVKWYTNNLEFKTQVTDTITPDPKGGSWTGNSSMAFPQPVEGKIEIYWNEGGVDQLAITLYFVVRP